MELSARNYQAAWNLLEKRYKNTRLIIHSHVKSIVEHDKMQRESHIELRQLLDSLRNHLHALQVLG